MHKTKNFKRLARRVGCVKLINAKSCGGFLVEYANLINSAVNKSILEIFTENRIPAVWM